MPEDGEDDVQHPVAQRVILINDLLFFDKLISHLQLKNTQIAQQEVFTPTPGGKVMTAKDWKPRSRFRDFMASIGLIDI